MSYPVSFNGTDQSKEIYQDALNKLGGPDNAATELPVSIFTSLLGVPFLLYLIIKPGRETR